MTAPGDGGIGDGGDGRVMEYATECAGGGDALGAPALARFGVERATAAFILRMAALVHAEGLQRVVRIDDRVEWLETLGGDGAMRSERGELSVEDDGFGFSCRRKHCDERIETARCCVARLAAFHGLALPAHLAARGGGGDDGPG